MPDFNIAHSDPLVSSVDVECIKPAFEFQPHSSSPSDGQNSKVFTDEGLRQRVKIS